MFLSEAMMHMRSILYEYVLLCNYIHAGGNYALFLPYFASCYPIFGMEYYCIYQTTHLHVSKISMHHFADHSFTFI